MFDIYDFSDISTDITDVPFEHTALDICGCTMCHDGGEDAFGVDGAYNIQYNNVPSTDLSSTKPSYTYEEAGMQISRWDAKWDDSSLRSGAEEGNAAGTAGYVTYSFLDEESVSEDSDDRDYRAMTFEEIARTMMAINEFEEVANITFARRQDADSEYLSNAQFSQMDFQAIADYNGGWASPSWTSTGEDGDLDAITSSTVSVGVSGLESYGSWSYKTAVHEIGHAVGLPHPGDYNGDGATTYENQAVYAEDTYMYTVMSYWSHTITGGDTFETVYDDEGNSAFIGGYATGLLLHDIAALHRLYGANMDTRAGDTVYGFNSTEDVESHWNLDSWQDFFVAAIWDGGGVDTIDASGYYEDQVISLVEEDFSSLGGLTYNLSIAKGVVIENAIGGAGDDILIGNSSDNILDGGAGIDVVDYSVLTAGINFDVSTGTVSGALIGTDTLISIEGIIATNFDDVLVGDDGDNYFIMLDGDDTITGGAGVDWISLRGATEGVTITAATLASGVVKYNGIGTNTFTSIEGIEGTEFSDSFFGDDATQYYAGGAGNDRFVASFGADTYDGGLGRDLLDLRASVTGVSISLSSSEVNNGGDFGAFSQSGFENVLMTESDDWINATSDANSIFTYGGDDTVYAQQGNDFVDAGGGNDYVGGWYGNDRVYGGGGDDEIEGQFGDDALYGQTGNDDIDGGEGNDWMYGQAGDDLIVGGDGNDNFFGGTGTNTMSGDAGNDRFFIDTGGSLDTIDGGDGDDRVVYRNFTTQAVTIDLLDQSLNAGAAAGHTLTNIETIDGTQMDDVISGSNTGRDKVFGWDGDDVINGRDGDDLMWGVNGDDTLNGGAGFDQLRGGSGNDIMNGGAGDDLLDGGADDDTMFGGAGIDKLIGNTGNDTLHGGDGDDRVTGQSGDDILNGDAGNDDVLGGDGNDVMSGDDGDDFMRGNNGDDIIDGGAGADTMYGDGGADTFVFEAGDSLIGAEDYIRRFEATDTIEIAGHTFVATNAFSGSGSFEVRYESTSAGTFIEMDRDGDGAADERIDFDGDRVWTFVSDGTDITGVVSGPEDGGAWG